MAVHALPAVALQTAANANPVAPSGKASVSRVCGTAKKGEFACYALRRDDIKGAKGVLPNATDPAGYGPGQLTDAYDLPADGGAGATVAIVDAYDNPNAEADLAVYRAQYGLPPCTPANGCFKKIDQRGGTSYPAPNQSWSGEISLDVDMVSAVAPLAKILLVEADTPSFANMGAAVDQAVAQGAKYVSNSYGSGYDATPGSGEDPTEVTDLDQYYNHPGVAMVASSGDDDFGVSYPAASQWVTSVGGTSLVTASNDRGWSESVWHNQYGGPGSGCSAYEAKPSFQKDSGCSMRSVADVSAVSDPVTGVAVYQTYGNDGWSVYGGTRAAAPIIAGVYAIAGTPVANTYPNSYPYANPGGLNDVTAGTNGTCTPSYLCNAGAGYDGPTGLGTPKGPGAFSTVAHGNVSGTVTDSATGQPVGGAKVSAGGSSDTTDSAGKYSLSLPVGTYDVTVDSYGYQSVKRSGVTVADGQTVTENFTLTQVPHSTVGGVVTDGSGHGWPLYAKISVDGVPGAPVFTDPGSGHYSLDLPQNQTYTVHVTPVYGGYQSVTQQVQVGSGAVTQNVSVPVDLEACTAAGYKTAYNGERQSFDGTTAPAGWTVDNGTGTGGWSFTDVGNRGNKTGGTGGFAIVDSDKIGSGKSQNTTLTSPPVNLSGQPAPTVSFDTDYYGISNQTGDVDVSSDGGATWTTIWHHTTDSLRGPAHVDLPQPDLAGKTDVRVRFHFTSTYGWWWQGDNVLIGSKSCTPVTGGLVYGQVQDANTGGYVTGATVSTVDAPGYTTTSVATPDDPDLGDGFYWLFVPLTGNHVLTAQKKSYSTASVTVKVAKDYTAAANFSLKAGQLTVTPASIDKTVAWGGSATATLTLKNTGTAPATVTLGEQAGGFDSMARGGGAAQHDVKAHVSKASQAKANRKAKADSGVAPADTNPAEAPWTTLANYPTTVQDAIAGTYNGKFYSAFGYTGGDDTNALYVYDPDTGAWSALAPATVTREAPVGGYVNGKLYVSGGFSLTGAEPKTEIYGPASNTWSTGAPNPKPYGGAGSAVAGGKLYQVGGCLDSCGSTDAEVYDPASNTWSSIAAYPESTAWLACGGINGTVYCAGGTNENASSKHTFAYDPGSNSWSPRADMPTDIWAGMSTVATGRLLLSGGVADDSSVITNRGFTYGPASDGWATLPNSNATLYRGAGACGFFKVGGNPGGLFVPPVATVESLPGWAECGTATTDVPWLSLSATTATIQPGKTAKVTVTLNAASPEIVQPGTYTAAITVASDTPYGASSVPVSMTVNPPKTWGKISGTVTSTVDGKPVAGATVQIDTWTASYTLKTDKDGKYELWLDVRNNPLQVIAAKDGYAPQVKTVKIVKGTNTTADFALKKA